MLSLLLLCYQSITVSFLHLQVRKTKAYGIEVNFPDTKFSLDREGDRDPTAVPAMTTTHRFLLF